MNKQTILKVVYVVSQFIILAFIIHYTEGFISLALTIALVVVSYVLFNYYMEVIENEQTKK